MYEPDDFFYGDVDIEQAELKVAGREAFSRNKRMKTLRAAGRLDEAADICPHGGGFPLDSIAASEGTTGFGIDPFAGEEGYRCIDCGSRLSGPPWEHPTILVPCEV